MGDCHPPRAGLFENACTAFLHCLRIKTIVYQEMVGPNEFKFAVEFMDDDGRVFGISPCCHRSDTEMPFTQFYFIVKKVNGWFLVQRLPLQVYLWKLGLDSSISSW